MLSTKNQAQFKELLTTAVSGGASDIHLSVGAMPIMRVNGTLQIISEDVVITTEFVEELATHLASLDEKELTSKSELFFAINLDPTLRVKVTIFYQKGLPAVTLRFISQKIKTIEQLHLPPTIEALTNRSRGLIIIAGPYGSGKNATIAALVQSINSQHKRYIVMLEKPIENIFTSQLSIIEQREVGRDTESFERGLRYLKHEDVDVIVVSEFSNEESIMTALELARGNALVIVAIEASSVVGSIEKIMHQITPDKRPYTQRLLSEVLVAAMATRLIPKIGGGLIPAVELLLGNESVRAAIERAEYNNIENIITTGIRDGLISFDRSLVEYVQKHLITPEDATKYAKNQKSVARMLGTHTPT